MPKKFIVFTPSYDENVGGPIALHRLCHLLNELGEHAEVFPFFHNYLCERDELASSPLQLSQLEYELLKKEFKINETFNTPVVESIKAIGDWKNYIVIYPEVVYGNPLGAKNVVRWLLHNPGFHTGKIKYGEGELYFRFASCFEHFSWKGSKLSERFMKIIYVPTEYYNLEGVAQQRSGTAYCLRKGKGKKITHDLSNSICIDGMSHQKISGIFKKVKRFISYDPYTLYFRLALLCGCEVVVVPQNGMSVDEWMPDISDRHGMAYGNSQKQLKFARETVTLQRENLMLDQLKSELSLKACIQEMTMFFSNK